MNGVYDPNQANNIIDGVVELIRLAKGERGEKALPEEFAHFALDALGENPIVERLINLISSNNFVQEILGENYEDYRDRYGENEYLLAKEAAGKLIARHMLNNQPKPQSGWRALLNRVIQAVKNFWGRLSPDRLVRARHELNSQYA